MLIDINMNVDRSSSRRPPRYFIGAYTSKQGIGLLSIKASLDITLPSWAIVFFGAEVMVYATGPISGGGGRQVVFKEELNSRNRRS